MDEILAEAKRRVIEVISAPTSEVCELLEEVKKGQGVRHPALQRADGSWSEIRS